MSLKAWIYKEVIVWAAKTLVWQLILRAVEVLGQRAVTELHQRLEPEVVLAKLFWPRRKERAAEETPIDLVAAWKQVRRSKVAEKADSAKLSRREK
ncbi:hypothetical protein RUND412_005736 [Rhizina undulata]